MVIGNIPNPPGSAIEKLISERHYEQVENHIRERLSENPTQSEILDAFRYYDEEIRRYWDRYSRVLDQWANIHTHPGGLPEALQMVRSANITELEGEGRYEYPDVVYHETTNHILGINPLSFNGFPADDHPETGISGSAQLAKFDRAGIGWVAWTVEAHRYTIENPISLPSVVLSISPEPNWFPSETITIVLMGGPGETFPNNEWGITLRDKQELYFQPGLEAHLTMYNPNFSQNGELDIRATVQFFGVETADTIEYIFSSPV